MDVMHSSLRIIVGLLTEQLDQHEVAFTRLVNRVEPRSQSDDKTSSHIIDDYVNMITVKIDYLLADPSQHEQIRVLKAAVEGDPRACLMLPKGFKKLAEEEKLSWIAINVVGTFMVYLCENYSLLWFKESWFELSYESFKDYLSEDVHKVSFVAPLDNFSMNGEELCITPYLKLRKLGEGEKQNLWQENGGVPGRSVGSAPTDILGWKYAVCGNLSIPMSNLDWHGAALKAVRDVITCLRIIKPAKVNCTLINLTPAKDGAFNPSVFESRLLAPLPIKRSFAKMRFMLEDVEVEDLQKLYVGLSAQKASSHYNLAVTRFNLGYDRAHDEDRLIDYWVALESMFASDSNQELQFRLCLRISRYVGKTREERESLFKLMKESYGFRSKIVHGSEIKSNIKDQISISTLKTEQVLRTALQQYLDPQRPFDVRTLDAEFLA